MSRVSSVLFGSVVLGVAAGSMACTISAQTKDRFTQPNYIITDTAPWAGETISINIQGVGLASNGGVTVIADPNATVITANARLLAMADTDDKPSADQSIADAKATFGFGRTTAGEIDITCGHGGTHGTSDSGASGCELVEIHVPIGSAGQKLSVKTLSGNGTVTLTFAAATIGSITSNAQGAQCDIVTTLPDTQGGIVSLVSGCGGNIAATLPTAFSADKITLEADPGKTNVGPFTDITTFGGGASQPRGTVGAGLASLNLVSQQNIGESGTITLSGD